MRRATLITEDPSSMLLPSDRHHTTPVARKNILVQYEILQYTFKCPWLSYWSHRECVCVCGSEKCCMDVCVNVTSTVKFFERLLRLKDCSSSVCPSLVHHFVCPYKHFHCVTAPHGSSCFLNLLFFFFAVGWARTLSAKCQTCVETDSLELLLLYCSGLQ